jgi:hypothetical protein
VITQDGTFNGAKDMKGKTNRVHAIAIATALVLTASRGAAAQWGASAYGVAEMDTKSTLLLLGGLSAAPKGHGWKPLLGLQAYHLGYDGGSSRTNVFVVRPSIGLENSVEHGAYYASIGYAFSNKDNNTPGPVVASDRGEGVVLSGGADWSTPPGPWAYQALGSYNFGSESFWARGRATTRIGATSGTTTTRFGGEVAFLSGEGYSAWQPGLVMTWQTDAGMSFGVGAGVKIVDNGGSPAYFKVEFGFPVVR